MLGKVIIENGQKKIQTLTADTGIGAPVGSYLYLEKKSNPQGYLYCDGSTFDETVYPALYQYLGTNVLPDWREMGAKGAEKNTTLIFDSTETDPRTGQAGTQNHDVFTQGEFKDDQLQDHQHKNVTDYSDLAGNTKRGLIVLNSYATSIGTGVTSGARKGTVTRGKSKAVFIYIKATSGLTENQQEDVLNTINENNSYSTEEHPTGAKWIDGKPIYRRVFEYGNRSCNKNDGIIIDSNFPISPQNVVDLKCMVYPTDGTQAVMGLCYVNTDSLAFYNVIFSGTFNIKVTIEYTKN